MMVRLVMLWLLHVAAACACCRYDMGCCLPKECDGWKAATWGKDFCVWERNSPIAK